MTGKPIAPAGSLCPLFKKDVSKVCHKCNLYVAVRVFDKHKNEQFDHWDCAYKQQVMITRDLGQAQYEAGAAIEGLRNTMAETKLIEEALQVFGTQPQQLARVGAGHPTKLIEN